MRVSMFVTSWFAVVAKTVSVTALGENLLHEYSRPNSAIVFIVGCIMPYVSTICTQHFSSSDFILRYSPLPARVARSMHLNT